MLNCSPWRLLLLLLWWGPLLRRAKTGSVGQTAGELYQRWERYRRECQETLEALDPPAGLACNASFDMYVCWDYAAPNDTARVSCPWYLPWHRHVAAGFVLRQCGSDGQWGPWRDHSQCENPEKNGAFQDQRLILERLQVMYTVGYSLSLATLLLALLILSFFRRLRCTRNYIHINLFTSFMLRAAAILTRDRLLPPPGPYPGGQAPVPWNPAIAACRTAQIVTQYCVGANYTWLLVEGVYLHSLLVLVGGTEGGHFRCYLLLGWGEPRPCPLPSPARLHSPIPLLVYLRGFPPLSGLLPPHPGGGNSAGLGPGGARARADSCGGVGGGGRVCTGAPALFVIPWVIVRYLYENTQCWERNDVKAIWWIIRTPILMTILINFLIFIRILGILVSKLRTRQMRCPDYRLRLARSTLTLVPLLGVHEVVFAPVTEEQARGALRFTKLGFEIFLSSFQGFMVSVLYCFINKEVGTAPACRPRPLAAAQGTYGSAGNVLNAVALQVQSEIRRCWHRCRLRHSLGEERRQPSERASGILPSGSGPCRGAPDCALSSGTLPGPGDEASRVLESYC
ncbi:gastric inhibitory polypeptide receptor isoform X2 [Meles meles]|uniref:gastric inhibitory polypeptide receptor isoform X2 n=1 Tax=Meles meles TaxID=9662 RepID=UPI001E69D683|nr:gastric inhibitory polypeptide receptor isoform X2 [Meles meles]XP_045844432.1 gastric inhibitory polypeptide receptor isoform X2 [Meles meles]